MAKHPGVSSDIIPGKNLRWCFSVPKCITAAPKSPHWTPDLICREGSARTSCSKLAIFPPGFAFPPTLSGKDSRTPPPSTRWDSCSSTRSRCSAIGWPSIFHISGRSQTALARRRTSAQRPRSSLPSAAVSSCSSSLGTKFFWDRGISVVTVMTCSCLMLET